VRNSPGFYTFAFGITWGVGAVGLIVGTIFRDLPLNSHNPLWYVAGYGPSIAAVILLRRSGGWPAVGERARKLIPTFRHLGWYLGVVIGFPAISVVIASRLGYHWPAGATPLSLLGMLGLTLLTDVGPQGEEFGWRGFALPQILEVRSRVASAVIVGLIWGLWHVPLFFIVTTTQSRLSIPVFFVNTVSLSIIMTWVYLKTDGDLAAMVLIHLISNFTAGPLGVPEVPATLAEAMMASVILLGGGLYGATRLYRTSSIRPA
jgi:membrane protease YdiL (CAAX protease family)